MPALFMSGWNCRRRHRSGAAATAAAATAAEQAAELAVEVAPELVEGQAGPAVAAVVVDQRRTGAPGSRFVAPAAVAAGH